MFVPKISEQPNTGGNDDGRTKLVKALSRIDQEACTSCPSFALMEEIRQLQGLRRLRLKTYQPAAQEVVHLDEMIHARLVKLMTR